MGAGAMMNIMARYGALFENLETWEVKNLQYMEDIECQQWH